MMIQAVALLALASSSGFASDESALVSWGGSEKGSANLVGEFSISPQIKDDLIVSSGGESLTAHAGIVMTESGQGGSDSAGSDSGGEDFNNDIYDKKKNTKKRKTESDQLDPYQWWTQANAHHQVHFMSTFNPS
jgi:hypothetical protein